MTALPPAPCRPDRARHEPGARGVQLGAGALSGRRPERGELASSSAARPASLPRTSRSTCSNDMYALSAGPAPGAPAARERVGRVDLAPHLREHQPVAAASAWWPRIAASRRDRRPSRPRLRPASRAARRRSSSRWRRTAAGARERRPRRAGVGASMRRARRPSGPGREGGPRRPASRCRRRRCSRAGRNREAIDRGGGPVGQVRGCRVEPGRHRAVARPRSPWQPAQLAR